MKNFCVLIISVFMLISCSTDKSDSTFDSSDGKSGSMACFTIAGNYLYTVDNRNLTTFDITNPQTPIKKSVYNVGFGIETVFVGPRNTLFLGSNSGMYIFSIKDPSVPSQISYYQHIYSCDPVVATDSFAFVTLRSGSTRCWRSTNELQVVNITNLSNPVFVNSYPMKNPKGLGFDKNMLFVCDDSLKVFDAANPKSLKLKYKFDISGIDVIPNDSILMVMGENTLTQYLYKNGTVTELSKLTTNTQ